MSKINLPVILKSKYSEMAEHTKKACEESCDNPYSCCAPEYCELAIDFAKEEYNIELKLTEDFKSGKTNLPMLNLKIGCTVEPYLRPSCTLHFCQINSLGIKLHDPEWTKKYFELREELSELELERFIVSDS